MRELTAIVLEAAAGLLVALGVVWVCLTILPMLAALTLAALGACVCLGGLLLLLRLQR